MVKQLIIQSKPDQGSSADLIFKGNNQVLFGF